MQEINREIGARIRSVSTSEPLGRSQCDHRKSIIPLLRLSEADSEIDMLSIRKASPTEALRSTGTSTVFICVDGN